MLGKKIEEKISNIFRPKRYFFVLDEDEFIKKEDEVREWLNDLRRTCTWFIGFDCELDGMRVSLNPMGDLLYVGFFPPYKIVHSNKRGELKKVIVFKRESDLVGFMLWWL